MPENEKSSSSTNVTNHLAPWFSVRDVTQAVSFYKEAFGAEETYRLEVPGGGLVVKLSVLGPEFWISDEPEGAAETKTSMLGGGSVRMILTVADPDSFFAKALAAGGKEVYPVGEQHGWRLGRLTDPFGLHWEIGHQLVTF